MNHLYVGNRNYIRTGRQLAFWIKRLEHNQDLRSIIAEEVRNGAYDSADQAIEAVLDFLRYWAQFHFPRLLRAVDAIQREILGRHSFATGDYGLYAARVESLFTDPALIALEEYGVPLPLAMRLRRLLEAGGQLDATLRKLHNLDIGSVRLHPFEEDLLQEAKKYA
jgi:hypothetical protein